MGEAEEDAGGGGEFAAEGSEEGLQAGQQEHHEEEDDAAGDEHHEGGVGEGAEDFLTEFFFFLEVGDEADEDFVQVAGGFAGLDEVDGRAVEDGGERAHRAGELGAFAQLVPEAGADETQARLFHAHAEETHGFAGGESAGGEVNEGFEEREAFAAGERSRFRNRSRER